MVPVRTKTEERNESAMVSVMVCYINHNDFRYADSVACKFLTSILTAIPYMRLHDFGPAQV